MRQKAFTVRNLRKCAERGLTSAELAYVFGRTSEEIKRMADDHNIELYGISQEDPAIVRARWAKLIEPLKDSFMTDIWTKQA